MKLRAIATLALTLALVAGSASAQSIGVYFDDHGGSCSGTSQPGSPINFWILANLGGASAGGLTGAEFRVSNFPSGWFGTPTPNPASNVSVGNPIGSPNGGCNIAFPACQPGSGGVVLLYTVNAFAISPVSNHYMQVLAHSVPSNPNFICPLQVLCDAPVFTKICVNGGVGIINGPACTVAVAPKNWSTVKGLYN